MAFTPQLTLDRAADVVFGDTSLHMDWMCGVASIVPLITLNIETSQVVKFEAERLVRLRPEAIKNVEQILRLVVGKPAGFIHEMTRFRTGMNCFEEAVRIAQVSAASRSAGDGDRTTREALWDILEDEVRSLEKTREEFFAEIQGDIDGLDNLQRQHLEQAEKLLRDGLLEAPLERSRILRESRRLFRDLTSEVGAELSCAVWAQYCWLTWQLTANEDETMIPLEFAVSQASSANGPGKSICARLYAYLLSRLERHEEAYQWSYAAAAVWPCVGTFHERARYAATTGRTDLARKECEALIQISPLGIVRAFSDPVLSIVGSDCLEGAIREQIRLRQLARQETSNWESAVKKSGEVRRRVPSITLPADLTDGVDATKALLDESSFLCAAQLGRKANSCTEDLKCLTVAALQAEKRRRTESVKIARANVEASLEGRDKWIKASLATHEESLKGVRALLAKSDSSGETAQRGCGWGLSTGCAVLMLYGALAILLSVRGIMIGPNTPWGEVMISLAALPVVVALIFHIVYSAKRMVLEANVNAQVSESNARYEKSREDANEQFRGLIESSQAQLAEEEKLLLRVEDAIRAY